MPQLILSNFSKIFLEPRVRDCVLRRVVPPSEIVTSAKQHNSIGTGMSSIESIGPQHPVPVTQVLGRRKRKPAKSYLGGAYNAQSYEVRIDGSPRGRFEEMDDALLSAAIARQEYPDAHIYVADLTSGYLINRID